MPKHRLDAVVGSPPECPATSHSPAVPNENPPGNAGSATQPGPRSVEPSLQAGLIAGIIGYAVAAAFFAVASVIDGRTAFDLATLLRGTLFVGTPAGADTMVVTGPVFAYNGPRLVTFLVSGVFIAWLASVAERPPQVCLVACMLLVFVAAPVLGLPTVLEAEVQAELAPWVVTTATSLAALAMAAYLWTVYPALRGAFPEPEDRSGHS